MQKAVEVLCARLPFAGGRDDLNIVHDPGAVGFGQAVATQVRHRQRDVAVVLAPEEEKVVIFDTEVGHSSGIYGVGVGHDQTVFRLTENFV